MSVLEIDSVVKSYSNRPVLTDVYLKCQTGDIVGLLGRNGTGKSTLLKILFGTVGAQHRFVRIDGKVYQNVYRTAGEVSYLPQDSFLPKQLTVLKTIELFLGKAFVHQFENDEMLGRLLRQKNVDLSGGELKYFEIKLLLSSPSKFILLDEPFNGIAPVVIDKLKEMIKLQAQSKGIILTDHDYRNVLAVANQHYLLYDGSIKHISTPDELVRWGYLTENSAMYL